MLKPRFNSSKEILELESFSGSIVKLDDYRYRMIVQVSSLNFELFSESEKDRVIDNYSLLLNSLPSGIQIIARTRSVDIKEYLKDIEQQISNEKNSVYSKLLSEYHEFVAGLVNDSKVLSRQFFLVIIYDSIKKISKAQAASELEIRLAMISKGLARLGIFCRKLSNLEIAALYFDFFSSKKASEELSEQSLEISSDFIRRQNEKTND